MNKPVFLLLLVLIISVSCVKDIDLDQIDEIEILTDHNISLIHFELGVDSFLDDSNNEILVLSDTTRLPLFTGPYTQNYLIQADFEYILSNTFDRNISLQYELLDVNDLSLYNFPVIEIPQGSVNIPIIQSIVEAEIPAVLMTDQVVVKFILRPGSIPLDPIQDYIFNLKSGLILHYKLTVEDE